MKLHHEGKTLCVSEVPELGLAGATDIASKVYAALTTADENVVIDLSETTFMDCGGLGALLALRKTGCSRPGSHDVRLNFVNPTPPVRRLLNLTHLDDLVEARPCLQVQPQTTSLNFPLASSLNEMTLMSGASAR